MIPITQIIKIFVTQLGHADFSRTLEVRFEPQKINFISNHTIEVIMTEHLDEVAKTRYIQSCHNNWTALHKGAVQPKWYVIYIIKDQYLWVLHKRHTTRPPGEHGLAVLFPHSDWTTMLTRSTVPTHSPLSLLQTSTTLA